MIGALIGTAARAALTGAAGLAVVGVLKEARVGDTLHDVAVTVTEVGVRGVKLVETGAEKLATVVGGVFKEAVQRVDADAETAAATDARATPAHASAGDAEAVVKAAEEAARGAADEQ